MEIMPLVGVELGWEPPRETGPRTFLKAPYWCETCKRAWDDGYYGVREQWSYLPPWFNNPRIMDHKECPTCRRTAKLR